MALINNPIIYITFGILHQLLVEVKSQTVAARNAHTATLIDEKLYILGGVIPPNNNVSPKETFLYLDLTVSFNTDNLAWINLSDNNIVPPHQDAAVVKGGVHNNSLFLYGGRSLLSSKEMALVYAFDTQSELWSTPNIIVGIPPTGKTSITPIIDHNGKIYLFGGAIVFPFTFVNDMFILDSIILSWKKASSINAPSPRAAYGAVLLPNNNIIYMGM
jgi:N-acetylneuraminic acid mutarotase